MSIILALAFAVATSGLPPQPRFFTAKPEGAFARVPFAGPPENAVFTFGVGSDVFALSSSGELRRYRYNSPSTKMTFSAKWDGYPEQGWYFLAPEGLYLALQMSDVETGWTELYLLNPETFELLARREFPTFNFGPALLTSDTLYVAGIGYLAALDRKTLKYRSEELGSE